MLGRVIAVNDAVNDIDTKPEMMPDSTAYEPPDEALPKTIREYLGYLWRYDPKRWSLFLFQDFVHFSRYPVAFIFVGLAIDTVIGASPQDGIPVTALWMVLGIFGVLALGEGFHIWTAYLVRRWKPKLRAKIRKDFFNYALGHSHGYYQDNFAGSIARKVIELAESSWRLHDTLRFNIFGSIVAMLSATISMFIVSPLYAAGMLLFLFSVTIPVCMRLKRISGRARTFSERRAAVTGVIVDIFGNVTSMRNFARHDYEESMHDRITASEQKSDSKRILTLVQIENYRRASFVILGAAMMGALLLGWQAGIVSVGQMSAVMGQSFSMVGYVWMFGVGVILMADEMGCIDDAIRTITPAHSVCDKPDAARINVVKGDVEFRNVCFSYGEVPVFKGLNLDIPAGQRVGLIGASGAGKTTLVSTLLRLFDIQDGQILIDGQNIAGVTQNSLREAISVVPQDTTLFHRSLIENIRYGRLDASDTDVKEAARKAYAEEFIAKMPQGYNTVVGERGIKLSGGQRQRITIARTFLKDAPILVLDEATSALDSESEQLIQESFEHLMAGKTVIAIAHRLSTIAHMDRLLVVDDGEIVEDGTHEELLRQCGLYAKLWSMQSNGFLREEEVA